jgi:hypothetical protein
MDFGFHRFARVSPVLEMDFGFHRFARVSPLLEMDFGFHRFAGISSGIGNFCKFSKIMLFCRYIPNGN